jgi:hypothetical protein
MEDRRKCEFCGKRLKYESWASFSRRPYCRACGREQTWAGTPSTTVKVATAVIAAPFRAAHARDVRRQEKRRTAGADLPPPPSAPPRPDQEA